LFKELQIFRISKEFLAISTSIFSHLQSKTSKTVAVTNFRQSGGSLKVSFEIVTFGGNGENSRFSDRKKLQLFPGFQKAFVELWRIIW